ncbi:MAG: hypothetical protein JJT94_14600 [Bernardetiaceae bacterium]|nr:hypothetical protein [Bernardetiaceae bacterium]
MKLLHQSKYVEILYDESKSLIVDKFLSTTDDMTTEEFKEEMYIFVKMCEEYHPARELVHLIDMQYPIVPEVQDWMNEEIFPRYLNIIKRMAFLMPAEIVAAMAVEQTMQEDTGKGFVQAYFDNEADAIAWLLEE